MHINKHPKEGCKKDGARLFLGMPGDRTRGNEYVQKHRQFPLNIKKHFFTERLPSTHTSFPEKLWNLHPWKPSGCGLGQPAACGSALD